MSLRVCAFGELGTGKTLSIVYELIKWLKKYPACTVYSNMPLSFPYVKIDDPAVIFDIKENSAVILDELWHIADSRRSMSVVNDVMCMLLIRSRKKGWFVGYTQQDFMQTDKRIRYVTDLWIKPEMVGKWLKINYFKGDGSSCGERVVDGSKFWDLYDSQADPFTLNVEKLKALWEKKNNRF